MLVFNKPCITGNETQYINEAISSGHLSGDGDFTKLCHKWFIERFQAQAALLTPSCTHALEMCALLLNVQPDDEIIMPSFTFVSTANAFAMHGAKIVFIDVDPSTMNMDEKLVENAITSKTKAIVAVHYGGTSGDIAYLAELSQKYKIALIEDAAQALLAKYDGKLLGTYGDLSTFSFHETKNLTSGGEGGLLLINNAKFVNRAEIIREKGTNRSSFFRGAVDKYTWVDIGSSFLPSEIQAAYLWAQLESADEITEFRKRICGQYTRGLQELTSKQIVTLAEYSPRSTPNGHMFYIKCANLDERSNLIEYLKSKKIMSVFHYIPLHSSPAGLIHSRFYGKDVYTTKGSEQLLRLPIWYGISSDDVFTVCECIKGYYT